MEVNHVQRIDFSVAKLALSTDNRGYGTDIERVAENVTG
jgi:hypothetical protein